MPLSTLDRDCGFARFVQVMQVARELFVKILNRIGDDFIPRMECKAGHGGNLAEIGASPAWCFLCSSERYREIGNVESASLPQDLFLQTTSRLGRAIGFTDSGRSTGRTKTSSASKPLDLKKRAVAPHDGQQCILNLTSRQCRVQICH